MKRLGLIFSLFQFLLILVFWRHLPPQLPLLYSRPWGSKQLVSPQGLLLLPALSLLVFLLNTILTKITPKEEKLIDSILRISAGVFSLLCLVTLIKIINLLI